MDNYSVEELTKEADLLYAKFMKSNYSTFADNKPKGGKNMASRTLRKLKPFVMKKALTLMRL